MGSMGSGSLCPALVVDDDPAGQQRVRQVLREVAGADATVATASGVAAAREQLSRVRHGLALVDVGLRDGSAIGLLIWMQQHCPDTRVVVLTACQRKDVAMSALRAGAVGYLLKQRDDAELCMALRSVQAGGVCIGPVIARHVVDELMLLGLAAAPAHAAAKSSPLSEREAEILNLVARGYTNREVARMTCLSPFTVEGHIKTVYRKLSVGSRTAAVFEARALGLLQ